MNKIKFEILLLVCMVLIGACLVCYNNKICSVMEPVFVVDKGIDDDKKLYIKVKVLEDKIDSIMIEKKIIIKQKSMWNLINVSRAYQVEYTLYPNQEKVLSYIDQANNYEERYRGYFVK